MIRPCICSIPLQNRGYAYLGFPLDRAGIDYDLKVFAPKPTVLAAWYVGGGIDPSCREVKFVHEVKAMCPSMDGFSGSPVFWVPKIGAERFYTFVGMLVRGNPARGFFLSGSVIARGLDNIMDQNPSG